MNTKTIRRFLLLLLPLFLFSCKQDEGKNDGVLRITTTTNILRDVVQNMVGESVEVISLMGAGVDPHLYKASHGDIERLSSADVIVYNGLHLEGKMTEVFEKMRRKHQLIEFADELSKNQLIAIDSDAGVYDPHVWFSIPKWSACIQSTSQKLTQMLPSLKDSIAINTQKYLQELEQIDSGVRAMLQSIPEEKRVLITSHDAFQYFGQEYGVKVKGLQGISTLAESGLRDVTEMVNFIIEEDIKAIFVENSVPQKALLSVKEGCKGKGHEVVIGGELFSDALGEDRTPEGTYSGMILYNTSTIVKALK